MVQTLFFGASIAGIHCDVATSVGDPDPEPEPDRHDPHVFGHPGSGSFPFLIDVLSGLK
jgi:hypothetical protein